MTALAAILACSILGFILLLPVYWAWRLALLFARSPERSPEGVSLPHAAVIVCLRGADPSLERCLRGLLDLDYPSYEVWIVIDSEDDPAAQAVRSILEHSRNVRVPVRIRFLEQRPDTCSLKLSAQRQALDSLPEACAVVAFIDADVVPASDWLRSLAAPLADPKVGCTTGIRWYTPAGAAWGTAVRYIWNAGAETQRLAFGVPWGGSLAMRREVIHRADLPNVWRHCFCEDTSAIGRLRSLGLRLHFVPTALMFNDESIDLGGCLGFIRRQFMCVRLHHSGWRLLAGANLLQAFALLAAFGTGIWAGARQDWALAVGMGGLLVSHALGLVTAILCAERELRRIARVRGIRLPTFLFSWRAWFALPFTQILHIGCLLSTMRARRIAWRGITYVLEGKGKIRMVQYLPFVLRKRNTDPAASVV